MIRLLPPRYAFLLVSSGTLCAQVGGSGRGPVAGLPGATAGGELRSIQGTVRDESGAVKPGVSVTLTDKTGKKEVRRTDENGGFAFKDLLPSQYVVETQPGTKPEIDRSTRFFYTAPVDRYVFFDGGIVPVTGGRSPLATPSSPGRGSSSTPPSGPGKGSPSTTAQADNPPDDTLAALSESEAKAWLDAKASSHLAAIKIVATSEGKSVVHFKMDTKTIPTYVVVLIAQATLSEAMETAINNSGGALFVGIHRIDSARWLMIFRHGQQ